MILPWDSFASGYVRQIRNGAGNSLIPFNSIVLSASGSARDTLFGEHHRGSENQGLSGDHPYKSDCSTNDTVSWTKTYASIQGAFSTCRTVRSGILMILVPSTATLAPQLPSMAIIFTSLL